MSDEKKDLVSALQKLLQETYERINPQMDKNIIAKHKSC